MNTYFIALLSAGLFINTSPFADAQQNEDDTNILQDVITVNGQRINRSAKQCVTNQFRASLGWLYIG